MNEKTAYVLLVIGCAECRGPSNKEGLVEEIRHFDSIAAAKQHVADQGVRESWAAHPLGGEFYGHGSGDWWIAPSGIFARPAEKTDSRPTEESQ